MGPANTPAWFICLCCSCITRDRCKWDWLGTVITRHKVTRRGCAPRGELLGDYGCDQMKRAQLDLEKRQCCKAQVIPLMGAVCQRKKFGLWV